MRRRGVPLGRREHDQPADHIAAERLHMFETGPQMTEYGNGGPPRGGGWAGEAGYGQGEYPGEAEYGYGQGEYPGEAEYYGQGEEECGGEGEDRGEGE